MPRGYRDYSFVIDSSFQPFSMQEMLVPLSAYKDAYEKTEEDYLKLSDQSDKFKYLSETLPENSKARQIYEGYANDLKVQADDLARNGLGMNNRRALTNLKRRYNGEIGRLDLADQALRKEQELRRQMGLKDSSILYANDNLDIDAFLDNQTPNLYNISGNELYARGAQAGKSASSRIYSAGDEGSTLGGYYRRWVERNGYGADSINAFRQNAAAIPELQQEANAILQERGVYDNLRDNPQALMRAQQSVLNGIIDGAVYQESVKPVRDENVMSAAQAAADARQRESMALQREKWEEEKIDNQIRRSIMYRQDENGNWEINPEYMSDNYEMTPDGQFRKKTTPTLSQEEKAEQKLENEKGKALLKLGHGELAHNSGFDVTFGDDRQHYDYVGLMSNSRGKWRTGAIGDDVPGHGWGVFSSNNLENGWGTFSMESIDGINAKKGVRVLSPSELTSLLSRDDEFRKAFEEYVKDYPDDVEIQLVEVPNESDSDKKGYAIAVRR